MHIGKYDLNSSYDAIWICTVHILGIKKALSGLFKYYKILHFGKNIDSVGNLQLQVKYLSYSLPVHCFL